MNINLLIPTLLVWLLIGCAPHRSGPPELVVISRVDIQYFPETNLGKPWDPLDHEEMQLPDVFLKITSSQKVFTLLPRIENAIGELTFKHGDLPIYLQNPENEVLIEIYDKDETSDELIFSGYTTFWSAEGDENSHAIELKSENTKMLFTVFFDYND